jgi:membrane protease YdiL (CAAX protease family)
MQLLGNIAAIPLNSSSTNGIIEPVTAWIFWTLISIPVIFVATHLSVKVGLGSPIIEDYLPKETRLAWLREVLSYTILIIIVTLPVYLRITSGITQSIYPPYWQLVLASIQAGVREEIFSRLLLMSLFIWVGNRITNNDERPTPNMVWIGIILSAILFGLAHIDNTPYSAELLVPLLSIFAINSFLGVLFGWLYWRYGLEAAMLSHFLFDAFGSAVIIPVYLWGGLVLRVVLSVALILGGIASFYQLKYKRGNYEK